MKTLMITVLSTLIISMAVLYTFFSVQPKSKQLLEPHKLPEQQKLLAQISVTEEEAKNDLLECALYLYKLEPVITVSNTHRLDGLAKEYALQGRFERANELFQTSIGINLLPKSYFDSGIVYKLVNNAEQQLGVNRLQEAQAVLDQLFQMLQSDERYRNDLALQKFVTALIHAKMFIQAIHAIKWMDEPNQWEANAQLAAAMAKQSNKKEAIRLINETIEKSGVSHIVYVHLIGAYEALGKKEESRKLLNEIIQAVESDPNAQFNYLLPSTHTLAFEYQLPQYAYELLQSLTKRTNQIHRLMQYQFVRYLVKMGKLDQAYEISKQLEDDLPFRVAKRTIALEAFQQNNTQIGQACTDELTKRFLQDNKDANIAGLIYSTLVECYAEAKNQTEMEMHIMNTLQHMIAIKSIRDYELLKLSRILYQHNYPITPMIKHKLAEIVENNYFQKDNKSQ